MGISTSYVYTAIYIRIRILILMHNILAAIKIALSKFGERIEAFRNVFSSEVIKGTGLGRKPS